MTRFRSIAALLLLMLVAAEAQGQLFRRFQQSAPRPTQRSTGRYCNNPYCAMCNRLFGLMPGYAYVNGQITYVGRQATQAEKPPKTTYEPTPPAIVDIMLLLARLTENDVLLDPGCGDGRFLIKAVQKVPGCRAIGVEIDPKTADEAEAAIKAAGVGGSVLVVRGDATKHELGIATAVTLYLMPDTIKAVMPKLDKEKVRIVVSYMHPIPDLPNQKLTMPIDGQDHVIYFWARE